jgi:hypothetical protein
MPEPWDRRGNETTQAFEAFASYRDMGVHRSNARVGQALGKSTTLMDRWSTRHEWVHRAATFDARKDAVQTAAAIDEVGAMARRHAGIAFAIIAKAYHKLKDADADEFTVETAVKAIDLGVRIERISRGESTEITSLRGDPNAPLQTQTELDVLILSDPEAAELAMRLHERFRGVVADTDAGAPGGAGDPGVEAVPAPGGAESEAV